MTTTKDLHIGQIVRVKPGTVWCNQVMRDFEYVIVNLHDFRNECGDVIVVVQDKAWWDHCTPPHNAGHRINPEHGAYLSWEVVTPV